MAIAKASSNKHITEKVSPWLFFVLGLLVTIAAVVFASVNITSALTGALTSEQFYSVALPQCIALFGSGGTWVTSAMVMLMQRKASLEVAEFNKQAGEDLQKLKEKADERLDIRKRQLEVEKTAYLEIFGAATVYYYSVQSLCGGNFDGKLFQAAEAGNIKAAQHLIYVDDETLKIWHTHWTEARFIFAESKRYVDDKERLAAIRQLESEPATDKLTFRQRYTELKRLCKEKGYTTTDSSVGITPPTP